MRRRRPNFAPEAWSPPFVLEARTFWHGSALRGLRSLRPSASGALGPGIYLAPDPAEARFWGSLRAGVSGLVVYRVEVRIDRPYFWTAEDGAQHPDRVNTRVRREGYDAIVRRTMDGSIPELVVFDPAQVLSLTEER